MAMVHGLDAELSSKMARYSMLKVVLCKSFVQGWRRCQ